MTKNDARTRVARGAALLDEMRPGWAARIDTGRLNLSDGCDCILGQLEDWQALGFSGFVGASKKAEAHGFYVNSDVRCFMANYRRLQDEWSEAIADRLHPVESVEPARAVNAGATPLEQGATESA